MKKIKKVIFDYIKKDPYDDWFEHIVMKFVIPAIFIFLLFYCLWSWYMGYPPPGDAGFIQYPVIIVI